jgi:hypothetical protein
MTKIKKLSIPGLIINVLMTLSSGVCFLWLCKGFAEGEFFDDMGSLEELGIYSMLIVGLIGAAILLIFGTVIIAFVCSALSAIMKVFAVATGKGGFIIPCLVFEGALLLVEGFWFLGGLSTGIVAALFAIPFALSIVSFVFNVKVLKARGELKRAAEAEAEAA